MKYSISVLEKEAKSLKICLSEWDLKHYPESRADRQKRLDDLQECISVLKCVNDGINPFSESASIHCLKINKNEQV